MRCEIASAVRSFFVLTMVKGTAIAGDGDQGLDALNEANPCLEVQVGFWNL